jgi:hypothetical protein
VFSTRTLAGHSVGLATPTEVTHKDGPSPAELVPAGGAELGREEDPQRRTELCGACPEVGSGAGAETRPPVAGAFAHNLYYVSVAVGACGGRNCT